jgi:hypothetical protein
MPSIPRKSKGMYVELEDELREALVALATQNGRTIKLELQHAVRRHLELPPRLVTPKIAPAEVDSEDVAEPARKRGRPRKSPPA